MPAFALSLALALVVGATVLAGEALAEPRIKTEGCEVYATNQVDPIAGADHLHNQFGNTSTTDDSSGESLFANKETSCATDWFTSAAWFPVERGEPVSGISTYYRAPGNSQEVQDIPKGLQLLGEEVMYNCTSSGAGSFEESPPYGCRGDWTTRVVFPDCWNEDSLEETTMVSSNNGSCPPTHPYRIPEISFLIRHDNADGMVTEPLEVSGGVDSWEPYTEMHADYFAALQPAFELLVDRCLRAGRSCDDDASPGSQAEGAGAASEAAQTDAAQSDGGGASEAPVGAASGEGGSASPGPGEDSGGGLLTPPDSSEDGFVGMAVDAAFGVLSALWDSSAADLAEQITEDLGEALFFMPDPTGADALADIYDDAKKVMAPALLLGILIITLLKIVTSYNASGQSFSLAKLGHIVGVAVVLGTLPFVFGVLSTLSQDLTAALLPEGGDMMGAAANLLSPLTGLFSVTGPLTIIVALFALWVLAKVMIIALIKLITWPLLFIAANFVMPASLLPGCKHFAENYFKLVLIWALLPAVWALEAWLGARLIAAPEAIFGAAANFGGILAPGLFSSVIAVGVLWVISHTPAKMMALAFEGYNPGRSTGIRTAGRWVASAVVTQGTDMALRAAAGGLGGGAAGGAGGGSAGGTRMTETLRQGQKWNEDTRRWDNKGAAERTMTFTRSRDMSGEEESRLGNMANQAEQPATDKSRSAGGYPQPPGDGARGGLGSHTPGLQGSGSPADASRGWESGSDQDVPPKNPPGRRSTPKVLYLRDGEAGPHRTRRPDGGE